VTIVDDPARPLGGARAIAADVTAFDHRMAIRAGDDDRKRTYIGSLAFAVDGAATNG
jgi:hypothetical protein